MFLKRAQFKGKGARAYACKPAASGNSQFRIGLADTIRNSPLSSSNSFNSHFVGPSEVRLFGLWSYGRQGACGVRMFGVWTGQQGLAGPDEGGGACEGI
jgi:hypothetical protein